MTRSTSLLAASAALLLLGGVLAGCSSPGGVSPATPTASPPPSGATEELEVEAAWLDGGAIVAVLTRGSSTCVPAAGDVAYDAGVLSVTLADLPADAVCTMDYVLRGIPVQLPEGIDPAQDLEIEVISAGARADTELAGVPGLVPADGLSTGQPSAGWTDADGVFALLTWGSSGCHPVVQDAAVSAPGEIAVTLADPASDLVCTADFGPRVTTIGVEDADDDTAYELVLTGDGFEGARVPIVGEN